MSEDPTKGGHHISCSWCCGHNESNFVALGHNVEAFSQGRCNSYSTVGITACRRPSQPCTDERPWLATLFSDPVIMERLHKQDVTEDSDPVLSYPSQCCTSWPTEWDRRGEGGGGERGGCGKKMMLRCCKQPVWHLLGSENQARLGGS